MRLALLTALLAPLLVTGESPRLTVETGTTVTKTYRNQLRVELVELTLVVDGEEQEVPPEAQTEMVMVDDENIVFVDEYVAVEGGRATTVVRTFETLGNDSTQTMTAPSGEERVEESEGVSELEGRSIRFVWDDDTLEYVATFADDEEGDTELLEDLDGDADFLFLFPEEGDGVEVGDTWTLEPSVFSRISSPSGDLNINDEDGDEERDDDFSAQFDENLVGDFEMTFDSIEDGVAKMLIEVSVSTEIEMEMDAPEGIEVTQVYSMAFELEGELLWDMERGVAESFALQGDAELQIVIHQVTEQLEALQTLLLEGEFEATAVFE